MSKRLSRWLPAAIIPVAVVGAAIAIPAAAGASPELPERTAEEVLVSIAENTADAYSGTVEQTSDLGLPELPSTGMGSADGAADAMELLTADHELRVFVGGDDRMRLQILDRLAERNVVVNGDDVWLYDSRANAATHLVLPEGARASAPATGWTPEEAAESLLEAIEPSTDVTVDGTAMVAGRAAYVLTLTPDEGEDTLVASASLAVDAETGLPLSVEVDAVGQDEPAFSVAYTSIDFTAPDAGLFEFEPPAGATVEEEQLPSDLGEHSADGVDHPEPVLSGSGWDAVVALPVGDALASGDPEAARMLAQLTTAVDGGRAIETSLVSVLLTDDGRVLAGAVPVDRLVAAVAE
ncbi:MAG TPA: DUF2092 domain-containing protein [Naasia sp.]|jgi:outer membrane lipoprotein-sorting protein